MFTLSKWGLARHCLHSFTLDIKDKPSAASKRGNWLHEQIAAYIECGDRMPDDPVLQAFVRDFDRQWNRDHIQCVEPAVALNVRTGEARFLGANINRRYRQHGATDEDICGSADLVLQSKSEPHPIRVVDWKSGAELAPANESPQLLGLASVLTRLYVADEAFLEYGYLRENGIVCDAGHADSAKLEATRLRLKQRGLQLLSGDTAPVPGPHCRAEYCPARNTCKAFKGYEMAQSNHIQQPSGRMRLSAVKSSKQKHPLKCVVYGVPGVGKSTFGAHAPAPVFLDADGGLAELDVPAFPRVQTFQDVLDAIGQLTTESHEHKTIVVDTLDGIEPLIYAQLCNSEGKKDIESFGYGAGYKKALDQWRKFFDALEALRAAKGMHVVLLAHSSIRTHKNPAGDDYSQYTLKLYEKAAALAVEWADTVLFCEFEVITHQKTERDRVKGLTSGERIARTTFNAAWTAKNRYNLPETIPMGWASFVQAIKESKQQENAA